MNCRSFQEDIFEYMDETLSASARDAAEQHLSGCASCREALSRQRQVAHSLSNRFQGETESVHLPPEIGRRVMAAIATERPAWRARLAGLISWPRLAWPVATAAMLLVAAGLVVMMRNSRPPLADGAIRVQLYYVVPTYTFRNQEGFVVDSMGQVTAVVNETRPLIGSSRR